MRNRIFVVLLSVFFLAVFIYSPIHNYLMKAGKIPYENVGNVIEADKVYPDDAFLSGALNAIEEGKRTVVDTYTNHLPFYLKLTGAAKEFKRELNEPVKKYLSDVGDKIIRDKLKPKK